MDRRVRFYFVRHAESVTNVANKDAIGGLEPNTELSKNGVLQSILLGKQLRDIHYDHTYSSSYLRTQETCRIALGSPPDEISLALSERDSGDFIGETHSVYNEQLTVSAEEKEDPWRFRPGIVRMGESYMDIARRMFDFMRGVVYETDYTSVIVFSHSSAIRSVLIEIDDSDMSGTIVRNAQIVVVDYCNGGFTHTPRAGVVEFWFIRHAESEENVGSDVIGGGNPDIKLTDEGKRQASLLGDRLRGVEFDRVYTSNALRTQETCRIALGRMPDEICTEVAEMDSGDFIGLPRSLYEDNTYVREAVATANWTFVPGFVRKGESQQQIARRMTRWMKTIVSEADGNVRVAVFSHGSAIRFMLAEVLDEPRRQAYKTKVNNASISAFEIMGDRVRLIVRNDIDHLM